MMLVGMRAQHPSISLAPIMHWSHEQPPAESFFWEFGVEAEYVAEACELNTMVKRCPIDESDS